MARPKKFTLDFFVHDANARNDRKIKSLRRKHGNDGYAAYFCLLEMLCNEEGIKLDLSNSIDLENAVEECRLRDEAHFYQIVITCVEVGLFDRQLWEGERILFCPELHDRYVQRLEDRKAAAIRQQRKTEADNLQKRINQVEGLEIAITTEIPEVIMRDNKVSSRDKQPDIRIQNSEFRIQNLDLSLDPEGVREREVVLPSDFVAELEPEAKPVAVEILPRTKPKHELPVQPSNTHGDIRSAATKKSCVEENIEAPEWAVHEAEWHTGLTTYRDEMLQAAFEILAGCDISTLPNGNRNTVGIEKHLRKIEGAARNYYGPASIDARADLLGYWKRAKEIIEERESGSLDLASAPMLPSRNARKQHQQVMDRNMHNYSVASSAYAAVQQGMGVAHD